MPFNHIDKGPGDLIRSADWNAMGQEINRLGGDKLDRAGNDTVAGPLAVQGDLAVGITSKGASLRVLKKQEDGSGADDGAVILGTDSDASARLHLGYSRAYSWIQGQGKTTLALNPRGGNVGIGIDAPQDRLEVAGTLRVGSGANPLQIGGGNHTGFVNQSTVNAEISNDTGTHKTLMILGNSSAGLGRRVSVWDRLEVNGTLAVTGDATVGGALAVAKDAAVAGALAVTGDARAGGALAVAKDATVTGSATVGGRLTVSGALTPSAGNLETAGIMFPRDPGKGAGDAAWMRYYPRSGEACTLELGTSNDADDHIALMPSGNVGVGTNAPRDRLEVAGAVRLGTNANPLQIGGNGHTGFVNDATENAEISNDVTGFKALMILGNRSAGLGRRVAVWDRLEVDGTLVVTGSPGELVLPGDLRVPGAPENTRMLRGCVNANGSRESGAGFTVSRLSTGFDDIIFGTAFTGRPAGVVTQVYPGFDNFTEPGSTLDNAVIHGIGTTRMRVKTGDGNGNASDRTFCFIVMGPR